MGNPSKVGLYSDLLPAVNRKPFKGRPLFWPTPSCQWETLQRQASILADSKLSMGNPSKVGLYSGRLQALEGNPSKVGLYCDLLQAVNGKPFQAQVPSRWDLISVFAVPVDRGEKVFAVNASSGCLQTNKM